MIFDCPNLTEGRPRCAFHEREYQAARNRSPERAAYGSSSYRAMKPYGDCAICGLPGADTRDHITPLSAGGSNDPSNIQFVHRSCNSRKGPKTEGY